MKRSTEDSFRVARTTVEVTTHADAERADREFWFSQTPIERLRHLEALRELNYGFNVPELTPELFLQRDKIIRMGIAPNRIEIQTGIDGVNFSECYPRRIRAELDNVPAGFISLPDLKANKICERPK